LTIVCERRRGADCGRGRSVGGWGAVRGREE